MKKCPGRALSQFPKPGQYGFPGDGRGPEMIRADRDVAVQRVGGRVAEGIGGSGLAPIRGPGDP